MVANAITRRRVLRFGAIAGLGTAAAAALAGCGEAQIVEKEVIKVVTQEVPVEKVVTQIVEKEKVVEKTVEKIVTQVVEKEKVVEKIVTVVPTVAKRADIKLVLQTWWNPTASDSQKRWYDHYTTTYKELAPWVTLDPRFVPWGDMIKKYLASIAAGDSPDVFHSSIAFARDLWDMGTLSDITEYIKTDPHVGQDQFMESSIPYRSLEGRWWALPWESLDGRSLAFNIAHFEEAGLDPSWETVTNWTWDDLREASLKLTKREGDKVTRSGFLVITPHEEYFCGWLYSDDAKFYGEGENSVAFNEKDAAKRILEWHLRALNEDKVSIPIVAERPDINLFYQDAVSIMQLGTYRIRVTRDETPIKFEVTGMPKGPNGHKMRTVAFTNLDAIPTKAKLKDDAWEFIRWRASLVEQVAKLHLMDLPSSRLDFYETPDWASAIAKVNEIRNIKWILEDGGAWPFKRYSEINAEFKPTIEGIMIGEINVDEGLAELETKLNAILSKPVEKVV